MKDQSVPSHVDVSKHAELDSVERCLACEADRSGPLWGKTEHHEQRLGVVRRL
jgi:hypothetical protein